MRCAVVGVLRAARVYEPFRRAGTFAPLLRASDKPIAIACFRLVTFLCDLPLLSVPCLRPRIARLTERCAALPYRAIVPSWMSVNQENRSSFLASLEADARNTCDPRRTPGNAMTVRAASILG